VSEGQGSHVVLLFKEVMSLTTVIGNSLAMQFDFRNERNNDIWHMIYEIVFRILFNNGYRFAYLLKIIETIEMRS
jgi:hypothetical protein